MGGQIPIDKERLEIHCLPIEILNVEGKTEKYQCGLHGGLLVDPTVDNHNHVFCKQCLTSYMEQGTICPFDKKHTLKAHKFKTNADLENEIRNSSAGCINKRNGCKWIGKVFQYPNHVKICPKELRVCENEGCGTQYFQEDFTEHNNKCDFKKVTCEFCKREMIRKDQEKHDTICGAKPLNCMNNCGVLVPRSRINQHLDAECDNTIIKCPFVECSYEDKRKEIKEVHVLNCSFRRINCRYCRIQIIFINEDNHVQTTCPEFPLPCSLNCESTLKRKEMQFHQQYNCENYVVKCKWGCQFLQERKFIGLHEEECDYREVLCSYCKDNIVFCRLGEHYNTCRDFPINCSQDCGEEMLRKKLQEHINTRCINTIIPCSYEEYGCTDQMKRKDLNSHLQANLFSHHELLLTFVANLKKSFLSLKNHQDEFELTTTNQLKDLKKGSTEINSNLEAYQRKTVEREKTLENNLSSRVENIISSNKKEFASLDSRLSNLDTRVKKTDQFLTDFKREIDNNNTKTKRSITDIESKLNRHNIS